MAKHEPLHTWAACSKCRSMRGPNDDGDCPQCGEYWVAASGGEPVAVVKEAVSKILRRVIGGSDPEYMLDGKYVRWGLVQRHIEAAIDALARPVAPAALEEGEPVDREPDGERGIVERWRSIRRDGGDGSDYAACGDALVAEIELLCSRQHEQDLMWGTFRRDVRHALAPTWRSNVGVGNEEIVEGVKRAVARLSGGGRTTIPTPVLESVAGILESPETSRDTMTQMASVLRDYLPGRGAEL